MPGVNWPPKRGRHEVCYFDLVEDLRPAWADRGDVLHLKASWTKGGRERDIPIRTEAQRELLREAKQLAGAGSLIPAEMSYRRSAQSLQGADSASRHRPRPRSAAPLRAGALCGADGLEGPGCGRADKQATEPGAEADRSAGSADDLARAGARSRANNGDLLGSMKCAQHGQAAAAFLLSGSTLAPDISASRLSAQTCIISVRRSR